MKQPLLVFPELLEELACSWKGHPYSDRSAITSLDCEGEPGSPLDAPNRAIRCCTPDSPNCPPAGRPSPPRRTAFSLH